MSAAAGASVAAQDPRRRAGRVDRALVRLATAAAAAAVAIYLAVHRDLVLRPATELARELGAGGGAGDTALLGSFALLLSPPLALLLALAAAIWPWSRLYDRRPTLRLLATATLTSAVLVLLQIALGAAGALRPGNLAVSAAGLAAALVVADRMRRRGAPPSSVAAGGRAARLVEGPLAGLAARFGLAPPSFLGVLLGLITAASWLGLAAIGALTPPWGWDSLVYHLTDVFWFAGAGALEPFPHPAHQFHFPKAAELHSLWFYLLAGAGAEAWRVAGIALLPLAFTAGVAVRAAGELLGLRSALPWLAPATMLVPLALIQPLAGYTDLAFTGFLLAGFAFLLAALERGRTADWALTALACGLAMGSKLSFVYLCLPLVVLAARLPRSRLRPRVLARATLCALLFAAGCGFWVLPKLLRTGNPFYPVAVTLGGRTLLDGPAAVTPGDSNRQRYTGSLGGWLGYPLAERHEGRIGYSPDNGFGPQFAAAWLALPFALALALRRRRRLLARALLAAPATALAWLALSPWEHPRYALTACGFALLGLAAVEEAASRGPGASPAARRLLRATMVAALLFAAPAGLLASAPELPRVAARWSAGDWRPADLYPLLYGPAGSAFNWISEHGGEDTTVSFDRPTFVAPLFGWHGRNRVVYAAAAGEHGGGALPMAGSSRGWRRFLERERVDWLVVWRDWWEERPPSTARRQWIDDHPEQFEQLAAFGDAARILAPRAAPAAAPAGPAGELLELASRSGWVLEYATGATVGVAPDTAGGLRFDYQFLTRRPDYADLRLDLVEGDWAPGGRLVLELDRAAASPLLWVYLKEADARRSCRFRIAPRPAARWRAAAAGPAGSEQIVLELSRPDSRTPGFGVRRVASVHLVLDDGGSPRAASGSFRLHSFRLEPAGDTSALAGSS